MTILDSNIWIASFNKNDSQNKKAEALLAGLKDKVAVTEYIVLEVATILSMKVSKKTANLFLDFVLENEEIEILFSDEEFFRNITSFYLETNSKKLSFIDISLVYLGQFCRVETFDKNLKKFLK